MVFAAHRAGDRIARDAGRFVQALHRLRIAAADGKAIVQRTIGGLRIVRHIDAVRIIPLVILHIFGHVGIKRLCLLGRGHILGDGLRNHFFCQTVNLR